MNIFFANRSTFVALAVLAIPAATTAQVWWNTALPANPQTMMESNIASITPSTYQPALVECRNIIFTAGPFRVLRYVKVWGRSTTPVPMFRVVVARQTSSTQAETVFNALVAPLQITSHPLEPGLRQYTFAVGPVIISTLPHIWEIMIARDAIFGGTPWFWCQITSGGGLFRPYGMTPFLSTNRFVVSLSESL